jgi:NAD+ kinase
VSTFVLVVHRDRPEAAVLARRTAASLAAAGHDVRLERTNARAVGLATLGYGRAEALAGADVAVSLGGDGTMLHTVALAAPFDVPVVGVNLGQLGYLTEVDPDGLDDALRRFLSGDHRIEERMLLSVVVERADGGPGTRELALNEAVLEKTVSGHTVRLGVTLDGDFFTTYATDGLIVATPTGSTAYAFSARGPILAPTHRAILLTPVSPHMLFDRSLVLGPDTEVRVTVESPRPAALTVDGRMEGELAMGDAVVCRAAPEVARLVTFGGRDFHRTLKAKFGLNDR